MKVVVSFTTTPYRIGHLIEHVQNFLARQTHAPHKLVLYVARTFSRSGETYTVPAALHAQGIGALPPVCAGLLQSESWLRTWRSHVNIHKEDEQQEEKDGFIKHYVPVLRACRVFMMTRGRS
jgi:hypothetical protein